MTFNCFNLRNFHIACMVPWSSVNLRASDILFIINTVRPDTYYTYFYVQYYAISCVKGHFLFITPNKLQLALPWRNYKYIIFYFI